MLSPIEIFKSRIDRALRGATPFDNKREIRNALEAALAPLDCSVDDVDEILGEGWEDEIQYSQSGKPRRDGSQRPRWGTLCAVAEEYHYQGASPDDEEMRLVFGLDWLSQLEDCIDELGLREADADIIT